MILAIIGYGIAVDRRVVDIVKNGRRHFTARSRSQPFADRRGCIGNYFLLITVLTLVQARRASVNDRKKVRQEISQVSGGSIVARNSSERRLATGSIF